MALRKISDLAPTLEVLTLHLTAMLGAMVLAAVSVLVLAGCLPSRPRTSLSACLIPRRSIAPSKAGGLRSAKVRMERLAGAISLMVA